MDHQQPGGAGGGQHRPAGADRRRQQRDVVAEGFAEAAGQQEVPLHVDDDQRGRGALGREGRRFGFDKDGHGRRAPAARWS
jgi:hypothetical protein